MSDSQNPARHSVSWFYFQIHQSQFPWAFKDGNPKKRIAALELLGTLVLTHLNQASTKPHTAAILMELVLLLHAAGCALAPCHVPREQNQWADDLTHLRQHCLAYEGLRKRGFTSIPWREVDARNLLNTFAAEEVTPYKLQQVWNTLKWPSKVFGLLNLHEMHRFKTKKQALEEPLADTATKPQRKVVASSTTRSWTHTSLG